MKENKVTLSFDIPSDQHDALKNECAHEKITIEDFLENLVLQGIKDLKKKQLHTRLEKSIKESKEGKVKTRGSFAKHVEHEV